MKESRIRILFFIIPLIFVIGFMFWSMHGSKQTNKKSITVLNYGKYIEMDVLNQFEEQTGIHVVYEEYESPETMYTKYKSGAIQYDLICSSEYMVNKLIQEDECIKIDYSNIPNMKYISSDYMFDSDYIIPYFTGTLGLLYNTKYVSEEDVQSWNVLWNEKYKNKIIIKNSVRDALVPTFELNGIDINTTNDSDLEKGLSLLKEQKKYTYAYLTDDIVSDMVMENAYIALIYSGEANEAKLENEDLDYVVPIEGSNLWVDAWFIPKTCKHKSEVEQFLNFLCDPDVAYQNWDYVYYTTPNIGIYDMLEEEDLLDKTMFPDKDILKRCVMFNPLSDEDIRKYNDLWKQLKCSIIK